MATDKVESGSVKYPALDLERRDFEAVQAMMRHCGLCSLHRHDNLDGDALHALDSSEHAGGWSVGASLTVPGWDRQGLERLGCCCARPPLSQERLGRLSEQTLVYSLRRPTADGRTELLLVRIIALVLGRPTAEVMFDGAAGALAAAAGVRVRPDACDQRLAGHGPNGGAGDGDTQAMSEGISRVRRG